MLFHHHLLQPNPSLTHCVLAIVVSAAVIVSCTIDAQSADAERPLDVCDRFLDAALKTDINSGEPASISPFVLIEMARTTLTELSKKAAKPGQTEIAASLTTNLKSKEIWDAFKKHKLVTGPQPLASPKWAQDIIRARDVCLAIKAALQSRMEASANSLVEARTVRVCRAKLDLLPDFLERYYGLKKSKKKSESGLRILHARFGDLYNEDREYHQDLRRQRLSSTDGYMSRKDSGWDRTTGAYQNGGYVGDVNNRTPRADHVMSDPEDKSALVDWNRHRHSCDATWYFRRHCQPTAYKNDTTTFATKQYCMIHVATNGVNGDLMCGYNPSPQGIKQIHVRYSCNGVEQPDLKLPAGTKRVNLLCKQPSHDLAHELKREIAFFTAAPCAVSLPAKVKAVPKSMASADAKAIKALAEALAKAKAKDKK